MSSGKKQDKMRVVKDIDKIRAWHAGNCNTYEALAVRVQDILLEVIAIREIEYHTVTYRLKKMDAFVKKAMKDKYIDPIREIKDLAGVRVITYVESEARKVADVIEEVFEVNPEHSIDKSSVLGVDRVGYRTIQYVVKLPTERCLLPEFERFSGLEVEIQVRTILQHAWAEIEHDRNYKYTGILPDTIQRRFAVLAGVLELTDQEFDRISMAIDSRREEVAAKTKEGDLDIGIDSTSLREFLIQKFKHALDSGMEPVFGPSDTRASAIVKELSEFGIMSLRELDRIIPDDFEEKVVELEKDTNLLGLVREIMIIEDESRYFDKSWKRSWQGMTKGMKAILEAYNIDADGLRRRYDLVDSS